MKFIFVIFLMILFISDVGGAFAQSASNNDAGTTAPGLTLLEKGWRIDFYNPAFDKSAYSGLEEIQQARQDRKDTRRQNEIRAKRGLPAKQVPVRTAEPEPTRKETSTTYIYKIKIKNTGEKSIKTIYWDYVFTEPGSGQEVGREQFESAANLKPGKTKEIIMGALSPPVDTVDLKDSGKKLRNLYSERVVFLGIEYEDGTFWQANENPPK